LKVEILEGRYAAGSLLPATRTLAITIGVSRNTVLGAYELLCAEHLATARPGRGTRITNSTATQGTDSPRSMIAPQSRYSARARDLAPIALSGGFLPRLSYDLQFASPAVQPHLFMSWRRKQAAAASRVAPQYPAAAGLYQLRTAIADYVLRRRGIACSPKDVVVVGGTQQAMTLTARVVLDEGQSVVLEDPHYQFAHHAFRAHGARVTAVPVDVDGLLTSQLPKCPPRLIVVTPAHQFPSGVVMSLERRIELLNYAAKQGCWIFEDDYDGELHYRGRPPPALRSLDMGGRVIYAGTFSKTLFPGLRLGYIVCPSALREDISFAKRYDDFGCSSIEQTALATFLESRQYEKHLRKSLAELRKRRQALLEGLSHHLGTHMDVVTSNGGMHAVAWFRTLSYADFDALLAMAPKREVGLHPIHPFYETPPAKPGLMLGFAGLSSDEIRTAMARLALCLDDVISSGPGGRGTRSQVKPRMRRHSLQQ
jgi:GntR family transcriptional regulator/MocR family aminotransferase